MNFDLEMVKKYIQIPVSNCEFDTEIKLVAKELETYINLKEYYQVFDLSHNPLVLFGINIESKELRDYFQYSNKVIVLVCTLGVSVDKYLKRLEHIDKSKLLIADAVLSSVIEEFQILTIQKLAKLYPDYYLTEGFSPGYPGLDLSFQKDIFRMLSIEKRMGIKLTKESLMIPRKSTTCLIGISERQVKTPLGCVNCNLKDDCLIKEKGGYCGK